MVTKKQRLFLDKVKAMVSQNGYFPTIREIGKEMGLSSPATVHSYLKRLYERGHLKRKGKSWFLISSSASVPLMGIVPAGSPLEMFESLGEEIELPGWMLDGGGDILGLKVQGESMKDAYIKDGDIVFVKRVHEANTGDLVVAYLDDATITLKRLRKGKNKNWLEPENPDYEPIFEPFQVVGKVVGVLRRYR